METESLFLALANCYFCTIKPSFIFSGIMQQDNSEQVIIDPRLIARHYIRTWFFLDLISSIPLDYVFLIFNSLTGNGVSNKCENNYYMNQYQWLKLTTCKYFSLSFLVLLGLPGKLPNFACRTSFANTEISKIIELSSIASFIQTCSIC